MNTKITAVLAGSVVAAAVVVMASQAYALDLSGGGAARSQEYGSASVSANANGNVETSTNVATSAISGTASASASAAAEVLLNKPTSIAATSDLATYDDLVIKARPVVSAINLQDNNNIAIQYSQPARLFGIFPSSISGQVVVDAKGNAAIEMPWWAIFYAKDTAGLQASIDGAVAQSGASFSGQADAQVQLQNKARIIDAVTAALQAQVIASTSVATQ